MGSDNRNVVGIGRVTLVAGGMSYRVMTSVDYMSFDVLVLDFDDPNPAPTLDAFSMFVLISLLALCAGYSLRIRFASNPPSN